MNSFKVFNNPDDAIKWAISAFSSEDLDLFDINKISPDSPLSWYTGSFSHEINTLLRSGRLSHPTFHYELIQNDLLKQKIPDNIITYRYVTIKEFLILHFYTLFNRIYKIPNFLSTTLLPKHFNGQALSNGILITFYVHSGTHGIYLMDLIDASVQEYEVLFAHHSLIKRRSLFTFSVLPDNYL